MGPGGFRAMINDLVRPVERHGGETGRIREESLNRTEAPPADRQQVGARPEPGATPGPSTGQQDTPPPATSTQPTPSSEATTSAEARSVDLDASFLAIGDAERAFMTTLHPLISTPRAAKRFVNVYRLLKASAPAARRAALEDEANHRAVLLLLAMLTGYPAETTAVLRRLIEKDVKALGWWTLTRQVVREGRLERPATAEGRLRNEQWDQFEAQLDRVAKAWPGRPPVGPFVDWAPEVARYSFQSSRVLVGRSEPHEAPPAEGPTRASRRVAPPRGPASTGSSGRAAGRTRS